MAGTCLQLYLFLWLYPLRPSPSVDWKLVGLPPLLSADPPQSFSALCPELLQLFSSLALSSEHSELSDSQSLEDQSFDSHSVPTLMHPALAQQKHKLSSTCPVPYDEEDPTRFSVIPT